MPVDFIATALLVISVITSLTVEALKRILDKTKLKYSSNLLAAIVSLVISLIASIVYVVIKAIPFSAILVVEIIILMFLSFLVSTIGYDKVIQTIKQFAAHKNDNNNEEKKQ